MPIVLGDTSGLAEGISTAGGALAQALERRAQNRLQNQERETQQAGFNSLLDSVIAQGGENAVIAQEMRNRNVTPEFGLQFLKSSKPSTATANEDKRTFNENTKLIAGIQLDAKRARGLLQHSKPILEAIESGLQPGPGMAGALTDRWRDFFQSSPKEVQRLRTMAKRTILDLKDAAGIRLTKANLALLEESLFQPHKSIPENIEAYELWKSLLDDYIGYAESANSILKEDPNAMLDPLLTNRITDYRRTPREDGTTQGSGEPEQGEVGSSFDQLPRPKDSPIGMSFDDEDGIHMYTNDGKRWKKTKIGKKK